MKLEIQHFKCFENLSLQLKPLTILTGANGSGKSTIIQSILIIHECTKQNYNNKVINISNISGINLGNYSDISDEDTPPCLTLENLSISLNPIDKENSLTSPHIEFNVTSSSSNENSSSDTIELRFLSNDRNGPSVSQLNSPATIPEIGSKGEYLAQFLGTYYHQSRIVRNIFGKTLGVAVNDELEKIIPGASVNAETFSNSTSFLYLNDGSKTKMTNFGSGLSYLLPIIVSSITAEKSSLIMIENPEIHLHPKAQSRLGYFISKMARDGVKYIIETHSEHFINGAILASCEGTGVKSEDFLCLFFKNGTSPIEIQLDKHGNLYPFPLDFFDQQRQDYFAIYNATKDGKTNL